VFVAVADAAFTVTVAFAEVVPHDPTPVTVYVVVVVGVAVTVAPVVALNPVAGVHVYVFAPVAVSVADCPAQMLAEFTVTGVTVVQLILAVPKKFNGNEVVCEL
jgi:uncharacterized lipoprotein YbaY